MNRKLYSGTGLVLLTAAFFVFTLMNNTLFSGVRLDLTENKLFTLADGSVEIVNNIDEPINLYFFFSEEASRELTGLRSYAQRVRELLEEYELVADGRINLNFVDPAPFSEAEDQADEFGLQSVPVSAAGDSLYFGLAGTNALDDVAVIPFFQPDKEEFVEYEISKMIQGLITVEKPRIGLLSSLKVQGDVDMATFQTTPAWVAVQQLEQLFVIETIEPEAQALPEDIGILLVIHPKGLNESLLFSIDQFLMKGGRMLAFVDPLAEMDRPEGQQNPMMPTPPTTRASTLNSLTGAWGVSLSEGQVLGDSQAALSVTGPSGTPMRHLAILGFGPDSLRRDDVVTANLEAINVATAGVLKISDDASVDVLPLLTSSEYAMPLEALQFQFMSNPADLQEGFDATGERYIVGARLQGKAGSAYPEGVEGHEGDVVTETDSLNVILFTDTDILTDRLWVQVQDFFGQRIATPWADNGDLVINALDNLGGSQALISIRSRGRFTRPFEVVQDLRRQAEERYLASANDLQAQLAETERQLTELQSSQEAATLLTLTPEQEAALERFQDEKLRIRKQLRDVRHQLDNDIEQLGSTLKFINIALVPVLMTLLLMVINFLRMNRR